MFVLDIYSDLWYNNQAIKIIVSGCGAVGSARRFGSVQSFSAAGFKIASNRAKNGGNASKLHRADAAKIGLTTGLTIVESKLNIFGVWRSW